MPNEFSRYQRVAEQIKREVAPLIQNLANEYRWGMVTVTAADVSPDLKHAKVYVTLFGNNRGEAEIESELNHHSAALRHRLARCLRLKYIPDLKFVYDRKLVRSARVTALIDSVSVAKNGGQRGAESPEDKNDSS